MENVKKSRIDNSVLLIPLAGVINADNASAVAQKIAEQRAAVRDYTALVFDAKALTYISSAGLRIIMQVIKEEKLRKHAPVSMIEVSKDIYDILDIMLCNGEPMLIDMETLCIGQPIFDLQGIYVAYKAFPEDEPDNATKFLGIRPETADYIWRRLLEIYFGTEADWCEIEEKIKALAYIRFFASSDYYGFAEQRTGQTAHKTCTGAFTGIVR